MTKKRRTDDDDEEGKPWGLRVLRDGERMRVPMTMIDSTGRSVLDSHAPRVNDSASVHRPGFHLTADQAAMDERDRAYREVDLRDENAWRNPTPTGAGSAEFVGQQQVPRTPTWQQVPRTPTQRQEGDLCTIDGAPGHLQRVDGELVCVPDSSQDALPGEDERDRAYREVALRDENAWRNAR